jgi:ribosomal protein L29
MATAKKTTAKKTPVEKDLKSLDRNELTTELSTARKELFTLAMKHSLGELKQPHLIRAARRNVAKIATTLHTSL